MSFRSMTPSCPAWVIVPSTWPGNFSSIIFAICTGSIWSLMRTVQSAKSITNRSFLLYALCSFLPYIAFLLYLFLQLHDSVPEGFRSRRTTRDEYVHGHNVIHPLHHAVGVEDAARTGAASHGDHIPWFRHLIIHAAQHRRHLLGERAGHDHEIGLPRGRSRHIAEHIEVMLRSAQELVHLDTTARKPERERPNGAGPHIIQELINLRGYESFFKPVLNYSHSSAPFFHA